MKDRTKLRIMAAALINMARMRIGTKYIAIDAMPKAARISTVFIVARLLLSGKYSFIIRLPPRFFFYYNTNILNN